MKSSRNVCNIAHSLADNLRTLFTCISGEVAVIVSLALSQFVIRKDCSNFISFSIKVATCSSYLSSKLKSFFNSHQSLGLGILPDLLSFLNQCPAVCL